MFANLEVIVELNSKFSAEMEQRQEGLKLNGIFADICMKYAPKLKIYVDYLNNYEGSIKKLSQLRSTSEPFQRFCRYLQDENVLGGLDLQDYLIKPVQRLPKYILLLKDLEKNTIPIHRDFENVNLALESFNEVCMHNNEQMDKFIRENKLLELYRKFCLPTPPPK